ncbi:MAG: YkgJ family cysteine cluster protein [Nanoarchaeota archaeon]
MKTPKSFRCKRCGSCCLISPFLSDKDIKRITDLGFKEDYFAEELRDRKFMKIRDNKCIFLEKTDKLAKCRIYKARPTTCRQYPTEIRDNGDCRPSILSLS